MSYSESYKDTLKDLHQSKAFGNKSGIPQEVIDCIEKYQITSLLDFGCGKGYFLETLKEKYPNIKIFGFDPANDQFQTLPEKVDMIYSSDVLEHIEPEKLEETILDLKLRCSKVMYHLIACHPSKRFLNDGRNAHLIVQPPEWWRKLLTLKLNLNIVQEGTKQKYATPKKGPPIDVVKYIIVVEI